MKKQQSERAREKRVRTPAPSSLPSSLAIFFHVRSAFRLSSLSRSLEQGSNSQEMGSLICSRPAMHVIATVHLLFYSEKRSAYFLLVQNDATLIGHVMYAHATVSNMVCSLYCARDLKCQSYNYYKKRSTCELNDDTSENNAKGLVPSRDVDYYEKLEPTLLRS